MDDKERKLIQNALDDFTDKIRRRHKARSTLKTCDLCEGHGESRFTRARCIKCDGTGKVNRETQATTCDKCGRSTIINDGYDPLRVTCLICGYTRRRR